MLKDFISQCVRVFILTAAVLSMGLTALAQDTSPKLSLKITSEKEVRSVKDGKEVVARVPATAFKNGDVVVYTITYKNEGASDAKDAEIQDPVPEGTVYIIGSAEGKAAEILFSIDGGGSFHKAPVKQAVKKADGSVEEMDAPAEMYTAVKWSIKKNVAPGVSGKVSFKVRVK